MAKHFVACLTLVFAAGKVIDTANACLESRSSLDYKISPAFSPSIWRGSIREMGDVIDYNQGALDRYGETIQYTSITVLEIIGVLVVVIMVCALGICCNFPDKKWGSVLTYSRCWLA